MACPVLADEDSVVLAKGVGDVFLHVIADLVGVPLCAGEQVLQAARGEQART